MKCLVLICLFLVSGKASAQLYIGGEFIYSFLNAEVRESQFLNASFFGGWRIDQLGFEGAYRPYSYQSRTASENNVLTLDYSDLMWTAGVRYFPSKSIFNLKAGYAKSEFEVTIIHGPRNTVTETKQLGYAGLGFVIPVYNVDLFLDYTFFYGSGVTIHEGSAGMRLYLGKIKKRR